MAQKLYDYSFGKLIIDIVSAVLYSDDTTALKMTHYRYSLTRIAAEGEQKGIKLLVVRFDLTYDIFFSVLCFTQCHSKIPPLPPSRSFFRSDIAAYASSVPFYRIRSAMLTRLLSANGSRLVPANRYILYPIFLHLSMSF